MPNSRQKLGGSCSCPAKPSRDPQDHFFALRNSSISDIAVLLFHVRGFKPSCFVRGVTQPESLVNLPESSKTVFANPGTLPSLLAPQQHCGLQVPGSLGILQTIIARLSFGSRPRLVAASLDLTWAAQ